MDWPPNTAIKCYKWGGVQKKVYARLRLCYCLSVIYSTVFKCYVVILGKKNLEKPRGTLGRLGKSVVFSAGSKDPQGEYWGQLPCGDWVARGQVPSALKQHWENRITGRKGGVSEGNGCPRLKHRIRCYPSQIQPGFEHRRILRIRACVNTVSYKP